MSSLRNGAERSWEGCRPLASCSFTPISGSPRWHGWPQHPWPWDALDQIGCCSWQQPSPGIIAVTLEGARRAMMLILQSLKHMSFARQIPPVLSNFNLAERWSLVSQGLRSPMTSSSSCRSTWGWSWPCTHRSLVAAFSRALLSWAMLLGPSCKALVQLLSSTHGWGDAAPTGCCRRVGEMGHVPCSAGHSTPKPYPLLPPGHRALTNPGQLGRMVGGWQEGPSMGTGFHMLLFYSCSSSLLGQGWGKTAANPAACSCLCGRGTWSWRRGTRAEGPVPCSGSS